MGRTTFDDLLAGLSRRERVGFVGALLSARGWDVERDSPVVRATRGDQQLVVAVAREGFFRGADLPREPVDAVVGVDAERTERLATAREARAWDARTLYDMARHGLDPATTDRLFGEYFGATSESVGRPLRPGERGRGRGRGESTYRDESRTAETDSESEAASTFVRSRIGQWAISLFVVLVLVGGGALAAQALTGMPSANAMLDGEGAATSEGVDASTSSTPVSTATPVPQQILPGLTTAGITDTALFARGHAAALTDRSFTMYLTYTERVNGEIIGTSREVVRVESPTVYRSTGTRFGDLQPDLVPVIVRDLYADGEGRYLHHEDGALRVGSADDPGTGQVVERSRALVAWYLSGDESTYLGGPQGSDTRYYRVGVEGTTDRRIEDYRATGLVSERGLVVHLDAHYRLPDSNRTVTVSLRYQNVGNTTVTRPAWMPPENESAN